MLRFYIKAGLTNCLITRGHRVLTTHNDSPNIHFLAIEDSEALAQQEAWSVERRIFLSGHRQVRLLPNLLAEVAVFQFRG